MSDFFDKFCQLQTLVLACFLQLMHSPCLFCAESSSDIHRPYRTIKNEIYGTATGHALLADIYRPDDERIYPTILMIHGGGWTFGDKWNLRDHARQFAQAGFVVVSINYRLAPKHPYPAQIEDCRSALRWIVATHQRWRLDPVRVAVYGYSAGGQLAALLATNTHANCPKIRAAVCGGTPCEFSYIPVHSRWLAHVMGGTRAEQPENYRRASPIEYVSSDDCPMFLFHGQHDILIPSDSSRAMFDKLRSVGVTADFLNVEGHGHMVTFIHPLPRRMAVQFLKQHLE